MEGLAVKKPHHRWGLDVRHQKQRPPRNIEAYMKLVNDAYVTDAYHSLSIEGYRVTPALIERVRSGDGIQKGMKATANSGPPWRRAAIGRRSKPHRKASAAFCRARILARLLTRTTERGTANCSRRAFSSACWNLPTLAGYRNRPVYIRKSMHVPLNREAVRNSMPAFFDLLREESHPAVRVVLGHFVVVYIHPYMDGNGRVGRFLMNAMMASAGYPWTVIPVGERNAYLNTLETRASARTSFPSRTSSPGWFGSGWLASCCHRFRSLPHEVFLISVARDQIGRKK
jgi:hypothetical protein